MASVSLAWQRSPFTPVIDQAIRLRVDVTAVAGLTSPKIFRYLAVTEDTSLGTKMAHFDGVCSVRDLVEIQADTPRIGDAPPWLRLDYLEVDLPTETIADEFMQDLQQDITLLCQAATRLATLTGTTEL